MSITVKWKRSGIAYIDTEVPDQETGELKRARISFGTKDPRDAEEQRKQWLAGTHPKHPSQGGHKQDFYRRETSTNEKFEGTDLGTWMQKCLSDERVWGNCRATSTHRSNVKIIRGLLPEGITVEGITSHHIYELDRQLRDEQNYAPASRRKLLGTLSASLRRAAEPDVGLIPARPAFPAIKVNNVKDRVISVDEERVMFECIEARRNAEPLRQWAHFERLCRLLMGTAFRLGEALSCGPSNVKRKRWTDHTGKTYEGVWLGLSGAVTKGGKPRDVPLTKELQELLPILNQNQAGGRWFPWKPRTSGAWYLLQNICEDMKLRGYDMSDVVLHTFRHTCATRLAEGGLDLIGLRDWLGHSDIKITASRYVHLMNGHIHVGAAILDNYGTHPSGRMELEETPSNYGIPDNPANGRDGAIDGIGALN
ncbi:MAG: site-specific integrase [Pseudomonadota bacterium]